MASMTELEVTMRRARLAYELGRARRAVVGFLPMLALVGATMAVSDRPSWTASLGLGGFLLGAVLLWYGCELKRAVLPGVGAGVIPLVLVLGARHFGHMCTGASCTTICMQACTAGGLLAGLAVAGIGSSRKASFGYWAAASALAIQTGAMACACLGMSGILGLGGGYLASAVPIALAWAFTRGRAAHARTST